MDINEQIQINQTNHQIKFYFYDINNIIPFKKDMYTAYFLPQCTERDYYNGKCFDNKQNICAFCNHENKLEELLIDGFYVRDDDYIAYLQTGIRVPVSKDIYEEWIVYNEDK